jgi:two-component system, NarL family, response regulator DevR
VRDLDLGSLPDTDGVLLKTARGHELVRAIRRVAAGEAALDPAVTRLVLMRLRGQTAAGERPAPLTPQLRQITLLIAEGRTNREIADAMGLTEKAVKNYVTRVLRKGGFTRRTELAVYVARNLERHSSH